MHIYSYYTLNASPEKSSWTRVLCMIDPVLLIKLLSNT